MSNPVKFSEAATLAIHAAGIMAGAGGRRTSAEAMAEALGVSRSHLVKVLQQLAKAGLVRSSRGPGGGYSLVRPAREVSVKEVYEVVEGPMDVDTCAMEVPACSWGACVLGDLLCRIGRELKDQLERRTIADFSRSVSRSISV